MPLLAAGHKRTGACPTFERPVLQRDGLLLRIPLVGGRLGPAQAAAVADVAHRYGNGVIELTNRGNLQVRGLGDHGAGPATALLRACGLGASDAAVVTISPFAAASDHLLRERLVGALGDLLADGEPLSPKFVVHVDDAHRTTASRRAEASVTRHGDGGVVVRIDGLGEARTDADGATATVLALASACRSLADDARVDDVVEALGLAWLHAVLPVELQAARPAASVAPPLAGAFSAPDGADVLLARPRFGRLDAPTLGSLAQLGATIRVTPWRSFVLPEDLLDSVAALGLIVDEGHPAAAIVSCIGAAGCWQTEADTAAEAERLEAERGQRSFAPGTVHVTGCDKRCATRSPVAVTLLGRADGSGFDRLIHA